MARDYAKKKSNKPAQTRSGKRWLFLGLVMGLLVAGGIYLHDHREVLNKVTQQQKPIHPISQAQTQVKNQAKTQVHHQPKFDFYQELTKENAPRTERQLQQTQTSVSKSESKPSAQYILQIAAFNRFADADSLHAKLSLAGFSVQIHKGKSHNTTWYRVLVGPYSSKKEAQKAQKRLAQAHYDSIILKHT